MSHNLAFVDIETTGLYPDRHVIWEIAIITDATQYVAHLDFNRESADPTALRLTRFYERLEAEAWAFIDPDYVARNVAVLLAGKHLVGAVPWFDAEFLRRFLVQHGEQAAWHYHLVDVEALMIGALAAKGYDPQTTAPPWRSRDLAEKLGVDQNPDEEHTALGDARWAKRCYEAVMSVRA